MEIVVSESAKHFVRIRWTFCGAFFGRFAVVFSDA
jgi:hypothetical protein